MNDTLRTTTYALILVVAAGWLLHVSARAFSFRSC